MTPQMLLRLLGVKKEQELEVLRIIDGDLKRVDIVDLGANGEGEDGFLVRKRKGLDMDKPFAQLYQDENGKWQLAKKSTDEPKGEDAPGIKMSAAVKDAIAAKIAELKKAHDAAEVDDSVDGIPDEVQQILGAKKAAEPESASAAEPEPEPAKEPEIEVPANLEGLFKSLTEAAGDAAETDEFKAMVTNMLGLLSPETQAMAAVSKRFNSELAEVKAENARLGKVLKALTDGAMASGFMIPDGTQAKTEPAKKPKAPSKYGAAPGMDLSRVGDDPDATYTIPQ